MQKHSLQKGSEWARKHFCREFLLCLMQVTIDEEPAILFSRLQFTYEASFHLELRRLRMNGMYRKQSAWRTFGPFITCNLITNFDLLTHETSQITASGQQHFDPQSSLHSPSLRETLSLLTPCH